MDKYTDTYEIHSLEKIKKNKKRIDDYVKMGDLELCSKNIMKKIDSLNSSNLKEIE